MVSVPLEVVRGENADLPEVLVHLRAVAIHQVAQRPQVTVELIKVARLVTAVVLDCLAVTRFVPRGGGLRRECLVEHIDLRNRVPTDQLVPSLPHSGQDAAFVDVIGKVDEVLSPNHWDDRDDIGGDDITARGSARLRNKSGGDECKRSGNDDQPARADLKDEGNDQDRAQAGADQVPEVKSLNFRCILGKNGDQRVARQEEEHEERQVQGAKRGYRLDRCFTQVGIVQGQGVDDRVKEQCRYG